MAKDPLTKLIDGFNPPLTLAYLAKLDDLMEADLKKREEDGTFRGKDELNCYQCVSCQAYFVCRDRDAGVTPFITWCTAEHVGVGPDGSDIHCGGEMRSMFYRLAPEPAPGRVPGDKWPVSHEWIRPKTEEELRPILEKEPGPFGVLTDHVARGGLILRRIEGQKTALELIYGQRAEAVAQLKREFTRPAREAEGIVDRMLDAARSENISIPPDLESNIKRAIERENPGVIFSERDPDPDPDRSGPPYRLRRFA